jgi:hypothetical protein
MLEEIDYTRKKSTKHWKDRDSKWLVDERVWRCKDYVTIKKLKYKFLYLDESAANENNFPRYGYSQKGIPYVVATANKTNKLFNLLCISEDKVVGC